MTALRGDGLDRRRGLRSLIEVRGGGVALAR